ncbi:MAG: helix-turn-helix domain-containing protein [bacterium]|nr:helix-turn-helix domain-containing protein [bacterium]
MDSKQAAALLGVKVETLYAYTSRGLLRSLPADGRRERRYLRSELNRLRVQRGTRRRVSSAGGFSAEQPLLDTSITGLSDAGPLYRGRPALELAQSGVEFEAVAELLWTGDLPPTGARWRADGPSVSWRRLAELLPGGTPPLICMALSLPALAAADPERFDTSPEATLRRASQVIPRLAASLALSRDPRVAEEALSAGNVSGILATAIGVTPEPAAIRLLEQTLILMADHELNASAFAARVAASTGADLYGCLSAAVGTASGPLHSGASEQVEALMIEAGTPENAETTVRARMRRGESIPGFGHLIYQRGDPRSGPLLEGARRLAPDSVGVRTLVAIVAAMEAAERPAPNADVGIAAVAAALGLAPGMGPTLFAVARCAGWVAHVLEQYEAGFLIRPRARYRGPE